MATSSSAVAVSQHQPLPSPLSCQSTLSRDSVTATVLSPLSVQSLDDNMDMDTDRRLDSTEQMSSSFRCQCRLLGDDPSSSNAHNNLCQARQQILELPPHQDRQLMMEVCGK